MTTVRDSLETLPYLLRQLPQTDRSCYLIPAQAFTAGAATADVAP